MHVTLYRGYLPKGTLGEIPELGLYILERPWQNNMPFESCIPEGTYEMGIDQEGKYTGYPELQNVPNRTEIIVHVANHVSQLAGCLAPGLGYVFNNGAPAVTSSADALEKFRDAGVTTLTITHKEAIWPSPS